MRNVCKAVVVLVLVGALLAAPSLSAPLHARDAYKKILKKWTKHDTVYVVQNLEARLDWHVTYQSSEFREAKVEKTARLLELEPTDVSASLLEEKKEADRYDEFFIGAYAGSSAWLELGKNEGEWSLVLESVGGRVVRPLKFERVTIRQIDRELYPYLEKWDEAYLVRFPKVVEAGEKFTLRMTGIPAKSELVWKGHPER